MEMTKGVLMVTIGVGGLVITIIASIVLLIAMKRSELNAITDALTGQQTDFVLSDKTSNHGSATDILSNSGTETELLISEQLSKGTDVLDPQGTEVLNNRL